MRSVRATLLVVGEGKAEVALAKHLRSIYTRDGLGKAVDVHDARGKGARHVINTAIRHKRQSAYDGVCALFDTDTDWSEVVEALARRNSIGVIPSHPCVEAVVLDILGERSDGTTQQLKRRFNQKFGGDAHDSGLIADLLTRDRLEEARFRVDVLRLLLQHLGV